MNSENQGEMGEKTNSTKKTITYSYNFRTIVPRTETELTNLRFHTFTDRGSHTE